MKEIKRRKKIDPRFFADLVDCVEQGIKMPEIAERLNVSYITVKNTCKTHGLKPALTRHDERKINNVVQIPTTYGKESLMYKVPRELRELAVNRAWR